MTAKPKPIFYSLVYILPSGAVCSRVVTKEAYNKHMTRIMIEDGDIRNIQEFRNKDDAQEHRQVEVNRLKRANRRGL